MAQPPLSRAIRELERQLGVPLLERTTRQVRLTAAGQVLLREARTALEAVTAAGRRARQAGQPSPRLRVALKADNDAGLLPRILAAYQAEPAALAVELVLVGWRQQARALRDGRADVALLVSPFDDRGLDVEPLLTEPCLAALAATDPLAARPCLRMADLAGRKLPDGSTSDLAQVFRLIELGSMICYLPASVARRYERPEIVYRPVSDLEPATLAVAWPQDSRSPAVAAFVRAAIASGGSGEDLVRVL